MELNEKLNLFGKKVSKTFSKTYKVATEKSGKLIEEAKLRMQIAGENDKISEKLQEIGAAIYEDYKAGESNYADFADLCKEIEESESSVQEMRSKILEMKKMKQCSVREAEIAKEDRFCAKCGAEQDPIVEEEPEKTTPTKCPYCDTKLAKDATFCSACGTKLEE